MTVLVSFRRPTPPLSENEARGGHWAKVRDALQPWRDAAYYSARSALTRGDFRALAGITPITVRVDIPFDVRRTRDPHNYVGTVVKAVVDGLVRASIVPDDNDQWVTVLEPVLTMDDPPIVRVHIDRRDPA